MNCPRLVERQESIGRSRRLGGRIEVRPIILPEASPPTGGGHGGYNETSFLMAVRPGLVEQDRLDNKSPWYCLQDQEKNSLNADASTGLEVEKNRSGALKPSWGDRFSLDRSRTIPGASKQLGSHPSPETRHLTKAVFEALEINGVQVAATGFGESLATASFLASPA